VSDERGEQYVDSTGTMNHHPDDDERTEEDEQYPLTARSFIFWLLIIGLGLLGTCVIISIFLALMRGS
jgi:hypothetical protein